MKILFTNNYAYLRGGSERVFFDEMQLLNTNGVASCVFSRLYPENYQWDTENFFPPHFEYNTGGIINKIKSAKELIYSNKVARSMRALIEQERPDVLHAHNIYGRLTTAIFDEAKSAGIPSVMTLHDYKLICPSYLLLRNELPCELCVRGGAWKCLAYCCHKGSFIASSVYVVEAYFTRIFNKFKNVKYLLCPSRFLLNKHIEGGVLPEKLVYIPSSIDVAKFTPQFSRGSYILFAGRLSREKGVKTLLTAMSDLDIPLKIAGNGPIHKELEIMTKNENLKNVNFVGYRCGDELKNLYQNAAFVVFPSEWYENAPMTILEAYGYGKPVIGSNIGGIPEMIVDGETGVLFPPGDSDVLRQKIETLWNQPALISRMGRCARDLVEQKYTASLHFERLMAVYHKAMA